MNVSAVIVTRGDVDRSQVIESITAGGIEDIIVWDNGAGECLRKLDGSYTAEIVAKVPDLAVYGRYAAIEYAKHDLIYVQDDDCVLPPESIARLMQLAEAAPSEAVVCNMPANFRHSFYTEHALVGFGAVFHRDSPFKEFKRFEEESGDAYIEASPFFHRTCDIVFTALTPRVLVDVPYEDMPWASAPNRMWKQPTHREERGRMLDLVLEVRDG